ncbi:serine/threonine-protein kinase [Planotetraspora sp. A-T 1434]|uniref:serine/threonine-protein kinase n=1 Tax=Planotetraspora sp. A-T 1434 TaxID=2979219 RepID=UPI0021BF542B|nr:serine/threonine-protein kinase [Planotetraspora sp. A-T 1434]MCT9928719.1 serine/threonine-protein kinase [Planotetraspora sp. A-T 1434]
MPQIAPLGPGDPAQLGPFVLSGRIGEGGQGVVYLGRNEAGEPAAVKLLHVKFSGDAVARSRFARELRAAQRVASFCTARVIAADLEGDIPYIASEYIQGESLRDTVEASGPLTGAALERLAVGTATALTAIHHAGIVHRDFKPDNVLIAADGPRVVDFGIARIVDSTGTITSRAIGTPAYMAPEQISGDTVGPPADVFAWGSTIAYAATGKAVFGGDSIAVVLNRILNHDIDVGVLPEPLRGVVRSCLSKSAAARPTADQILLRLLGRPASGDASTIVLSEGAHAANPDSPARTPDRPGRPAGTTDSADPAGPPPETRFSPPSAKSGRGRWIAVITAAVAVVAAGGAVAFSQMGAGRGGGGDPTATSEASVSTRPPSKSPSKSPSPSPTFGSVADKAARTHKLTIGVKGDLPGVGLVSGQSFSGFDVDVAKYVANSLQVPETGITFRRVTKGDRARALANGDVDLVFATYAYDDNKRDGVTFAGPYYVAHTDVLVVKDSPIRKLDDLTGRPVCAPLGSDSFRVVQAKVRATPVPAKDYSECMNKLLAGQVDAIPGDDLILAGFADRETSLELAVLGLDLTDQRYSVGLPRKDARTCEAVRSAISRMYDDGTMKKLLESHFSRVDFHPERDIPVMLPCRQES